ncbi:MAG: ABC transporter permease [Elusimicrobiota bacterium]|nr:ABC transporter permease [Endomicrobiia bacterium]MDW7998796.1 ABC transporter permease [Thermodesulfovibrio sp.]MDW8165893.1 ABC transporter permease [Elusimicrobiota bacterium]
MRALTQLYRVVIALLVRELKTRFGKYRLGFIWAFLEPMLLMSVFIGIRGIMAGSIRGGIERFIYHIEYPLFLASGLLPFFLFRHSVTQLMNTITANRGLFAYQPVKPIDAFLARWFLEGLIFIVLWIFIFGALYKLNFTFEIKNPLGLIAMYFLFYLFSFGIGLIFSIAVELFDELRNIISIIMLLLFFLSGIFFSILQIPERYRIFLLWNPVLHFIELCRENMFYLYEIEDCSYLYVIIATLVSLFLGLSLYKLKIHEVISER